MYKSWKFFTTFLKYAFHFHSNYWLSSNDPGIGHFLRTDDRLTSIYGQRCS